MLTNCDFSIISLLTNHIQMNTWNRVEKIYILKKKCIAIFFSLSLFALLELPQIIFLLHFPRVKRSVDGRMTGRTAAVISTS